MRFITCRLPDGVEDPAILSADGRQVWPLSWLGLSYETLSDAIPFLTPQVRAGLSLAIAGIPALPIEAVAPESPIPSPAQDVICLGINYMAHSDEAEKYSADAFATKHQDAIYFSKRVTRAVPDGGFIEAHTDLVKKLDYECELAVVLGKDAKDVPAGQTKDYVFGYTILNDVSARDVQTAHKQWYFGKSLDGFTPIGPCIVTADEFDTYPPKLPIRCFVNGEKRQDSNTGLQIFDIDHVIAELSQGMTLKARYHHRHRHPGRRRHGHGTALLPQTGRRSSLRDRGHRHPDEHSPLSNSYSVLYYFARFLLIRCIFAQDGSLFTNNSY